MAKNNEMGKALHLGVKRYHIKTPDTLQRKKRKLGMLMIGSAIGMIIGISYYAEEAINAPSWVLGSIGIYIIIAVIVGITLPVYEFDIIYEHGIRTKSFFLYELFIGRKFHSFKNITKIGYGSCHLKVPIFVIFPLPTVIKETNFLAIHEKSIVRIFLEIEYKNDFYNRLIETLKENCPNAEWEEVDWESL